MTPSSILAGDQNGANIESALHFCWYFVDGAIPATPTSYLQNLTFI
ncbi:MAG: hypothetical protein IT435_11155 [Phycisphaerales bacterium]|nr:hypothetical protein [Phycisphaerales bacterium]